MNGERERRTERQSEPGMEREIETEDDTYIDDNNRERARKINLNRDHDSFLI